MHLWWNNTHEGARAANRIQDSFLSVTVTSAAAAAAKSLQSCPTLCDPIDGSPPGSPVPGILQARTLEWVAISFSNAGKWRVKVKSLSRVRLFATPWTAAYQAPPSMGFSRQKYWSGVLLPSPWTQQKIPKLGDLLGQLLAKGGLSRWVQGGPIWPPASLGTATPSSAWAVRHKTPAREWVPRGIPMIELPGSPGNQRVVPRKLT